MIGVPASGISFIFDSQASSCLSEAAATCSCQRGCKRKAFTGGTDTSQRQMRCWKQKKGKNGNSSSSTGSLQATAPALKVANHGNSNQARKPPAKRKGDIQQHPAASQTMYAQPIHRGRANSKRCGRPVVVSRILQEPGARSKVENSY